MIRPLPFAASLYMALAAFANIAFAGDLEALRVGDMKKLVLKADGAVVTGSFTDRDGAEVRLEEMRGKVLVVNFWATWCAPCRVEMPSLNALDAELEADGLEVIAIASGRNKLPNRLMLSMRRPGSTGSRFILIRARTSCARWGPFGLPTTLVLGPDGREIGRLQGDADWASEEALTMMRAILLQSGV